MASTQWAATERLQVRVVMVEGMSIEGDLHLQPSTALHETRETPLELLNRAESFFPLSFAEWRRRLSGQGPGRGVGLPGSR